MFGLLIELAISPSIFINIPINFYNFKNSQLKIFVINKLMHTCAKRYSLASLNLFYIHSILDCLAHNLLYVLI